MPQPASVGERCQLSPEVAERCGPIRAKRQGTVVKRQHGVSHVLWDGRKRTECLFEEYLVAVPANENQITTQDNGKAVMQDRQVYP